MLYELNVEHTCESSVCRFSPYARPEIRHSDIWGDMFLHFGRFALPFSAPLDLGCKCLGLKAFALAIFLTVLVLEVEGCSSSG
jgi:hypothetical protein